MFRDGPCIVKTTCRLGIADQAEGPAQMVSQRWEEPCVASVKMKGNVMGVRFEIIGQARLRAHTGHGEKI